MWIVGMLPCLALPLQKDRAAKQQPPTVGLNLDEGGVERRQLRNKEYE
jgi:hypothetical protein